MAENVVPLPKRRSNKDIARAYFDGTLSDEDWPKHGGMRRALALATFAEREDVSMRAIEWLAKIADIQHGEHADTPVPVNLFPVEMSEDGKILRLEADAG